MKQLHILKTRNWKCMYVHDEIKQDICWGEIQFAMLYPVFVSLNYNMQLFNVLVEITNILCETLRL